MSDDYWGIYALGGGLGHLTRSVALARGILKLQGVDVPARISILTNSPFAGIVQSSELPDGLSISRLNPTEERSVTVSAVHRWVEKSGFSTLIVDTFPRGLGGELSEIIQTVPHRVLVQRAMTERYALLPDVVAAVSEYDLVLLPGEQPAWSPDNSVLTRPWLVRDSVELLSPIQSRGVMRASSTDLPIVAFLGCGRLEEVCQLKEWAAKVAQRCSEFEVRFFDASTTSHGEAKRSSGLVMLNHWPVLELLRGVDAVVSGGGYNSVHESYVTDTPYLGVARKRLYDCQERRLNRLGRRIVTADSLIASLHDVVLKNSAAVSKRDATPESNSSSTSGRRAAFDQPADGRRVAFDNGVHQAAQKIHSLLLDAK